MLAGFASAGSPVYAASQKPAADPDFAGVDRYVEAQMKECRIPGLALAVVRGDRIVCAKGYSRADDSNRGVTPQTPFIIGSVSKSFTALAILKLAEEGRIDLDNPVTAYIPWFATADVKTFKAITVRQLLSHTSGIGTDAEWQVASPAGGDSIARLVRRMQGIKPSGQPGDRFRYSNANYIILGEVIQRISGTTYEEYIKKNIFQPLGMKHSYASGKDALQDGMAAGYRTFFGFPLQSGLPYREDFAPAFYLVSSAEDMAHYMIALMNKGIYQGRAVFDESCLDQAFKPAVKVSDWGSYGAGWYLGSANIFHGGSTADFEAKVDMFPEDKLGVAIMYNTSDAMIEGLFKAGYRDRLEGGIINLLYGEKPVLPPVWGLPSVGGHPFSIVYAVYVIFAVLIAIIAVLCTVRGVTFRRRLKAAGRLKAGTVFLSLVLNLILPVYLLFQIPASFHMSWPAIIFNAPGDGCLLAALCASMLAGGLFKAAALFKYRDKRKYKLAG